jgi:Glyoxalase/Bleomycin resistance protein/Dioxygenase superfamily
MEELAGTGSVALEALGLNGSLRDRMCQEAIRTLRAAVDVRRSRRHRARYAAAITDPTMAGACHSGTMELHGVHHITAITGDAPANVEFYVGVLGLKRRRTWPGWPCRGGA